MAASTSTGRKRPPEPAGSANNERRKKRPVREVVKGAYLKVNLGPLIWLPSISNYTSTTGTEMDISFGGDVVDTLNFTLSVEGSFFRVTNGDGVSTEIGAQTARRSRVTSGSLVESVASASQAILASASSASPSRPRRRRCRLQPPAGGSR